jgi:ATP-binding cassette subfamily F protein uup
MTNLVTCKNLAKSYGAQKLFTSISFTVNSGDRIGVIGPNGSGKSTLLRILSGHEDYDSGEILTAKFCRPSYLAQSDNFDDEASVVENLYAALSDEPLEETEKFTRIHSLLSRADFPDTEAKAGELSGGWRKRLSICRSMLTNPDVLIMDEPTNHLDIEGILWLEKMLAGLQRDQAFLVVSHDRRFLENCASRIIEISAVYPEGSLQVDGNYSAFLDTQEDFLNGQMAEETRLANKSRRENEWLRRGPKARATKAKYRIDEAYTLQDDLASVKARNRALGNVKIDFTATGRKTKKLMELTDVGKGWDGRQLFSGLNLVLSPGSRLGLLGRNGCGKSTLMKILAGGEEGGEVTADSGTIRTADKVQIVHFDQRREGLNPEESLRRALAPDGDSVVFNGRSVHVVSWAKRFLFRPEQLETPVGQLSGGEQARILIAGLMLRPADILLLDEPTNDLDIPSLDVLEASLNEFPGALVLVTHDRYLLDSVCDRVLGFNGRGRVRFYADYEQWLVEMRGFEQEEKALEKGAEKKAAARSEPAPKKVKLSYLDQREYDGLEEKIAKAEVRVQELEAKMSSPEVAANATQIDACWQEVEEAKGEIDRLYARWEELEGKLEE